MRRRRIIITDVLMSLPRTFEVRRRSMILAGRSEAEEVWEEEEEG